MIGICKFKVCDEKPKFWLRVSALAPLSLAMSVAIQLPPRSTFGLVPSLMPSAQSVRTLLLERVGDGIFKMEHLDNEWKIESLDASLTKSLPERWLLSHPKAPHFHALLTHSRASLISNPFSAGDNKMPSHTTGGWQLERAAKELESSGVQVLRARDAVNPNGIAFSFFDLKTRSRSSDKLSEGSQKESFLRQNVFRLEGKLVALTCVGEKGNLTEHLSLCRELVEGVAAR